jgi:hypothetical protein
MTKRRKRARITVVFTCAANQLEGDDVKGALAAVRGPVKPAELLVRRRTRRCLSLSFVADDGTRGGFDADEGAEMGEAAGDEGTASVFPLPRAEDDGGCNDDDDTGGAWLGEVAEADDVPADVAPIAAVAVDAAPAAAPSTLAVSVSTCAVSS